MTRKTVLCGVLSLFVSMPALAQSYVLGSSDVSALRAESARVATHERAQPIRALLQKRVDGVQWDGQTFSDVIDWLRAQAADVGKISIVPRWRALEVESVDSDSEVTLKMSNVTVKEVLDETLDQLSDLDPITYVGSGNVLRISTKSDFDKKLFVRVYDLSDLMLRIKDFQGSPQIDLQQQQQNTGGGGGGSNGQAQVQSMFQGSGGGGSNDDDNEEDSEEEDQQRADEIMNTIKLVVEPNSWTDNGGLGSMAVLNKQLLVLNTLSVHEVLGGPFHLDE